MCWHGLACPRRSNASQPHRIPMNAQHLGAEREILGLGVGGLGEVEVEAEYTGGCISACRVACGAP